MLQRRIKVLQLITTFAKGGPGHVVEALVKNIDQSKFEITCCSMYQPPAGKEIVLPAELGFKHICLQMKRFLELDALKKLNTLIKDGDFDIVHTHLLRADWYGRVAARMARSPSVVSTIHNEDRQCFYSEFGPLTGRIISAINRVTLRLAHRLFAISQGVMDYLVSVERVEPERIRVIPNGIDLEPFCEMKRSPELIKRSLEIPTDFIVVGTIAALKEQKGLTYLIKAARYIINSHPRTQFVIVGSGKLEESIRKEIADLDLTSYVTLTGERKDVVELLSIMDIFVLPSLWEGVGIAVLEAMAMERPCVVTDIPGLREVVVPNVSANVVSSRNEVALANAIIDLLDDPAKRLAFGQAGRLWVEKHYSAKDMARQYEKAYMEVLGFASGNGRGPYERVRKGGRKFENNE